MTGEVVFNVRDHGGIQATLDLVSKDQSYGKRGGKVYIPRGQWSVENPVVVRGGRITLVGENLDTNIIPTRSGVPLIRIDPATAHDFRMDTLMLMGREGVTGNVGIECIGTPERLVPGLSFENVQISRLHEGVRMEYCDFPLFHRFGVDHCASHGMRFLHASAVRMTHSFVQRNGGHGIWAEESLGFYFQGPGLQANERAQAHFIGCKSVEIHRTDIEEFVHGIELDGNRGVVIQGCVFLPKNNIPWQEVFGVHLIAGENENSGVQITGNTFYGSDDKLDNYAHTTGVCADPDSTTDIFLAANGPGSAGPARLTLYDIAPGPRQFIQGYHTGDGFESQPSTTGMTAS